MAHHRQRFKFPKVDPPFGTAPYNGGARARIRRPSRAWGKLRQIVHKLRGISRNAGARCVWQTAQGRCDWRFWSLLGAVAASFPARQGKADGPSSEPWARSRCMAEGQKGGPLLETYAAAVDGPRCQNHPLLPATQNANRRGTVRFAERTVPRRFEKVCVSRKYLVDAGGVRGPAKRRPLYTWTLRSVLVA